MIKGFDRLSLFETGCSVVVRLLHSVLAMVDYPPKRPEPDRAAPSHQRGTPHRPVSPTKRGRKFRGAMPVPLRKKSPSFNVNPHKTDFPLLRLSASMAMFSVS